MDVGGRPLAWKAAQRSAGGGDIWWQSGAWERGMGRAYVRPTPAHPRLTPGHTDDVGISCKIGESASESMYEPAAPMRFDAARA